MKKLVCLLSLSIIIFLSGNAYACCDAGGLWLSTDPTHFAAGGAGYVYNSADNWDDNSYCVQKMPFTMYLYNATYGCNAETARDIGLIVAVPKGETNGSITIADAYGVETTLHYSDFSSYDPYPGDGHDVYDNGGVFAVLKPSKTVNLTPDYSCDPHLASTSSWTDFVVKSSSFSEVHFDAKSTGSWCGGDVLFTGSCNDVTLCGPGGGPAVPEPVSLSFLGLGVFGLVGLRKKKKV